MSLQLVKLVSPIEVIETPMSPADRVAAGFPFTIWGYRSEAGIYDDITLAEIAAAQAAGWPDYAIHIQVLGTVRPSGGGGSFALPSVSLQPVVTVATLLGAQSGAFAVPGVSVQPVVAAVDIAGQSGASFLIPAVSMQPVVVAPALVGSTAGTFTMPAVSVQPVVAAPTLSSAAAGSFTIPSVSIQPVVAAVSLAASAGGSFYAQNFTGATNGATSFDGWSASTSGAFGTSEITTSDGEPAPSWKIGGGDGESTEGGGALLRTMNTASGTMSLRYKVEPGSLSVSLTVKVGATTVISSAGTINDGSYHTASATIPAGTGHVVSIESSSLGGGLFIDNISIPVP